MNIKNLTARRDVIVARAAVIGTELDELLGMDELTEEQTARFAALEAETNLLVTERSELDSKIEQRAKVEKLAEEPLNRVPGGSDPNGPGRTADPYAADARWMPPAEARARALDAVEKLPVDTADDAVREQLTHQLERNDDKSGTIARRVLLTSSRDYSEAFVKAITGRHYAFTQGEAAAFERAMSLTDAAGGYAVPAPIDPTLILTGAGSTNPFRQISNVKTITTEAWKGVSAGAVSASWDGEAAEVGDDTPTFAGPSITTYKAQAFVPASVEIVGDYPSLALDLVELFKEAKDDLEATAFATGTGSSQPTGIVTAVILTAGSIVSATTDNSFGAVDVYALLADLPAKHRQRASFVSELATINLMRQFATADNYHAFITDMTGDTPAKLLGKPLYESSAMDGAIGTGDDYVLVYGDFRNYVIADRVGFQVEYIPHLFATGNNRPNGQRGWYTWWRVGADSVNDDAFRILKV